MSFCKSFEKTAALRSEILGTILNPLSAAIALLAGIAGLAVGKRSKESKKSADKASFSNMLIPGVAPYRIGRRIATVGNEDK